MTDIQIKIKRATPRRQFIDGKWYIETEGIAGPVFKLERLSNREVWNDAYKEVCDFIYRPRQVFLLRILNRIRQFIISKIFKKGEKQ